MNRTALERLRDQWADLKDDAARLVWATQVAEALNFTPHLRHVKRGTDYEVESQSVRVQTDFHLQDNDVVILYVDAQDRLWVRDALELYDEERFEKFEN